MSIDRQESESQHGKLVGVGGRPGELTREGAVSDREGRRAVPPRQRAEGEEEQVGGRGRTTPRQFLHEVNVEMRKVVWPSRSETANYSLVVLITLALLMAFIFGLDTGFSKLANFLFS